MPDKRPPRRVSSGRSRPAPPLTDAAGAKASRQRALVEAPRPGERIATVTLKSAAAAPLIYRQRIARADAARPGDLVAVLGPGDRRLGYGLFNPHSEIAVRMVRLGADLPDQAFWQSRLADAVALRRDALRLDDITNAYRLVHAEADGLSGLVVDRLGDALSAEAFSLGMYQRAGAILERLAALCNVRHTLVRPGPQFLEHEGCQPRPVATPDFPQQTTIEELGTRFRVRFEGGHKTGFFCDQRDNRRRLAEVSADKSVLDLCCYTGGFAIQAKRLGRAGDVTAVDLDEQPLALARENANLNQVRVKFVQADAFAFMRDMLAGGRRFEIVVLDPPKLIRTRAELEDGTRKHFDLNRLAMQLVAPGGLLLSCSCAGLLSEDEFMKMLYAAARQAGPIVSAASEQKSARHAARTMQILARCGAAPDHPVAANWPQTEYLKAAWLRLG